MVTNYIVYAVPPEVQVVMDMDGWCGGTAQSDHLPTSLKENLQRTPGLIYSMNDLGSAGQPDHDARRSAGAKPSAGAHSIPIVTYREQFLLRESFSPILLGPVTVMMMNFVLNNSMEHIEHHRNKTLASLT